MEEFGTNSSFIMIEIQKKPKTGWSVKQRTESSQNTEKILRDEGNIRENDRERGNQQKGIKLVKWNNPDNLKF